MFFSSVCLCLSTEGHRGKRPNSVWHTDLYRGISQPQQRWGAGIPTALCFKHPSSFNVSKCILHLSLSLQHARIISQTSVLLKNLKELRANNRKKKLCHSLLYPLTSLLLCHCLSLSACLFGRTAREAEMRQLRKTHMEYEERNAALQKHVESMRAAVERLEGDVMQERGRNSLLHQHLETLRQALTSSFCSLPLPGENQSRTHQWQNSCSTINASHCYPHWVDINALKPWTHMYSIIRVCRSARGALLIWILCKQEECSLSVHTCFLHM